MAEETKFSEEEIKEIEKIRSSYFDIQNQFGQVKLARLRLDEQLQSLDDRETQLYENFNKLQTDEKTFLESLTGKYGEGSLNPETGVFTANKSE
jgi:predicted nuclease with TOPRIM domain